MVRLGVAVVWAVWVVGGTGTASANGVCLQIDSARDNLSHSERRAVVAVIAEEMRAAGVEVSLSADSCASYLVAYSLRLGEAVTATIQWAGRSRTATASNIEELDLLFRQLVRAVVAGKAMATGTGITDRSTVLRSQIAPRRSMGARRWDSVAALGGGVLQLPSVKSRKRVRQYNLVSFEGRAWGFTSGQRTALELMGRLVLHDYQVVRDHYRRLKIDDRPHRGADLLYAVFAVPNYEAGIGFVHFVRPVAPSPFVRIGVMGSLLLRLSDPEHYADFGIGVYGGIGVQVTDHVGVSASLSMSNPVVHDFLDGGYRYFATGTVSLEFRRRGRRPASVLPRVHRSVPVQRRINE